MVPEYFILALDIAGQRGDIWLRWSIRSRLCDRLLLELLLECSRGDHLNDAFSAQVCHEIPNSEETCQPYRDYVKNPLRVFQDSKPMSLPVRAPRNKEKNAAYFRAWSQRNKEKHGARSKAYYDSHKQQYRSRLLLRTYGITIDDWNTIFRAQDQRCAACGSSDPGHKRGWWHTDHDHITGRVRGILCHPCNLALGCAKEDRSRLQGLLDYIKGWK